MAGVHTNLEIIPFRGEYYEVRPERRSLVKALIYPVPDPRFPFLGVHFTRRVNGSVEAGPNALLAFRREGYTGASPDMQEAMQTLRFPGFWKMARKYWRMGLAEQYRSWVKSAFVTALQKMVPELQESDLAQGGSGVRAQAVDANGNLVDDFHFVHSANMIHVCNVPSPAATASLEIGQRNRRDDDPALRPDAGMTTACGRDRNREHWDQVRSDRLWLHYRTQHKNPQQHCDDHQHDLR